MNYDVIIIGGGPAGLTAAIYCQRRELKTLVIAKAIGGQAALAAEVHNWPGEQQIGGFELAQKMNEQAKSWGAQFVSNEATAIEKKDESIIVKTNSGDYEAGAVILAFGLTPRDLGVPGEEKFKGRGVSYCATCDGPLFKGKAVAIVGAGNAGFEAAEYMAKLARQVYVINRSENFAAEESIVKQVTSLPNVAIHCNFEVKEIAGENKVESIILTHKASGAEEKLEVGGVFVEIGHTPKTGWLKGTVDLNDRGEIITDKSALTSLEGVFAAGDCTDVGYKQIVIAAGEGAKAALSAYKYIAASKGGAAVPDWGVCKKK